jgi:hypothetical protein
MTVDKNIKKSLLLKKDLPPVNSANQHVVRYRIVSEDFNRTSAWSPVYYVDSYAIPASPTAITVNKVNIVSGGGSWSVTWTDTNFRPKYDVFVKFDNAASYSYHGTVTVGNAVTNVTTYTFPNTGTLNVTVAIQPEGIIKTQSNSLKLFESALTTVA